MLLSLFRYSAVGGLSATVRKLIRLFARARFQIGDRIIEVDGVDLRQSTHERAVEVIQASGNPVCLLVQSLVNLVRTFYHDPSYMYILIYDVLSLYYKCIRFLPNAPTLSFYFLRRTLNVCAVNMTRE